MVTVEVKGTTFNLPDELYYTRDHAWARVESDGTVTIGANEFLTKLAKSITYVDLPIEGDAVEAGKPFATIESAKWVGKVSAPIAGKVIAVNSALLDAPETVNNAPYTDGWLVKIQPNALAQDLAKLIHDPNNIREWILGEAEKYLK